MDGRQIFKGAAILQPKAGKNRKLGGRQAGRLRRPSFHPVQFFPDLIDDLKDGGDAVRMELFRETCLPWHNLDNNY